MRPPRGITEKSMVMNSGRRGLCNNRDLRTSSQRFVPSVRSPSTGGIGRTCNASLGFDSQARRHPARRGASGFGGACRMLASMHESTPGSIVPWLVPRMGTVVTGGRLCDCYPSFLSAGTCTTSTTSTRTPARSADSPSTGSSCRRIAGCAKIADFTAAAGLLGRRS
jgi:hypothetical protein